MDIHELIREMSWINLGVKFNNKGIPYIVERESFKSDDIAFHYTIGDVVEEAYRVILKSYTIESLGLIETFSDIETIATLLDTIADLRIKINELENKQNGNIN